jgi:hypothetical protein
MLMRVRGIPLRRAAAGLVPEPTCGAESGFGLPLKRWLRHDRASWCMTLLDRTARERLFDPAYVMGSLRRWTASPPSGPI